MKNKLEFEKYFARMTCKTPRPALEGLTHPTDEPGRPQVYAVIEGPKLTRIASLNIGSANWAEELKLSEAFDAPTLFKLGKIEKMSTEAFAKFAQEHQLKVVANWRGYTIYVEASANWPAL